MKAQACLRAVRIVDRLNVYTVSCVEFAYFFISKIDIMLHILQQTYNV